MSSRNLAPVFPSEKQKEILKIIAEILREKYGESGSVRKKIARDTGAHPRAVKNWYEGRSAPSLWHFISLAKTSPRLTSYFLQLAGYGHLANLLTTQTELIKEREIIPSGKFYSIKFDTINSGKNLEVFQNLNQRQIWFYSKITQGHKTSAQDIASFWNVGMATAKRDISMLAKLNLIMFTGSKKNGYYLPM